jgi:hypothetical protein
MANIEKLKLRAARPRQTLAAYPLSSHHSSWTQSLGS